MTPRNAARLMLGTGLFLATIAFCAFGFNSYGAHDHGFTLGYSWRLVGGQIPYVDFYYRRPPATIYLHTIWFALPDGWALLASRAAYYLEMALATALPTAAAIRAGLVSPSPRIVLLSGAFSAVAIHNFAAMAWSTVDGVFFSSCGLALLIGSLSVPFSRAVAIRRAGASLAFAIAALAKQPFIFVAFGFALVTLIDLRRWPASDRIKVLTASAAPALALAALTIAGLLAIGAFEPFLAQTIPLTSQGDVTKAGLLEYLNPYTGVGLAIGLAWPVLLERGGVRFAGTGWGALVEAALVLAPLLLVPDYFPIGRVYFGAALGLACMRGVGLMRGKASSRSGDRLVVALAVVSIAWSASLSWGYRSPTLGLGAFALLLPELPRGRHERAFARIAPLVAAIIVFVVSTSATAWSNWHRPRYDRGRVAQTEPLHEIFPRFGYLYSNSGLASQMRELSHLIETYALEPNREFVVLNDFPLAHYLVDRQSPVLLDWYFWLEIRGDAKMLVEDIVDARPIVIILKKRNVSPIGWTGGFGVPCEPETFDFWPAFSRPVFEAGRLVASERYFCVVDLAEPRVEASSPVGSARSRTVGGITTR